MSVLLPFRMTPSRTGWPTAVVLAALSLTAAGCTRKVIAAAPAPVPLAVPSVPPRIVGPGRGSRGAAATGRRGARPSPAQRPALETAPQPAGRSRCRAAVEDPQRARAEGAEPAAAPPTPAPLLRTRETANDVEAAKKVQEVLRRAEQNLAKVNYRGLSANGRTAGRHRPPVHHAGRRSPREAPAGLRAVAGRQGRSPLHVPGQPLANR